MCARCVAFRKREAPDIGDGAPVDDRHTPEPGLVPYDEPANLPVSWPVAARMLWQQYLAERRLK